MRCDTLLNIVYIFNTNIVDVCIEHVFHISGFIGYKTSFTGKGISHYVEHV